jgi:hypothetical protein
MGKKPMNANGFWAAMMTIKAFELNVDRGGRMFIIFFLDNLTSGKIFLSTSWSFVHTLVFTFENKL